MAYTNTPNTNYKQVLDQYKAQAVSEAGVDLTSPNLTAKQAGTVGGRMVKNMINKAKTSF